MKPDNSYPSSSWLLYLKRFSQSVHDKLEKGHRMHWTKHFENKNQDKYNDPIILNDKKMEGLLLLKMLKFRILRRNNVVYY